MYDYSYYHELQSAKMREMENQARDRTPLWDLGESCAERSARFDEVRKIVAARHACARLCAALAAAGEAAFNAQFVSALEEDK